MVQYESMFQRNIGILTPEQQAVLRGATVAIAGVGGVGGLTAERLARLGIGRLVIADPEGFDASNFNRQFGASVSTVGRNKAVVVGEQLRDINPDLQVDIYTDGVTPDNIDAFVADADVVIDEVEYVYLDFSILVHRAARARGKYCLFSIALGFGANLFVFDPNGMSYEEYLGIPRDASLADIRAFEVPLTKMCPSLPSYINPETALAVAEGRFGYVPTVSVGCSVAASLLTGEVAAILLGIRPSRVVPDMTILDVMG